MGQVEVTTKMRCAPQGAFSAGTPAEPGPDPEKVAMLRMFNIC